MSLKMDFDVLTSYSTYFIKIKRKNKELGSGLAVEPDLWDEHQGSSNHHSR